MSLQSLPSTAEAYGRTQRAEIAAAVAAVRRQWSRMTDDFDSSWGRIAPTVSAITAVAQERVAAGATAYVPAVLAETGQDAAVAAFASPSTAPLIGAAGDGRPVDSLLYGSVVRAKTAVGGGASAFEALTSAGTWLSMALGTLLSDAGRQAESLASGVRPVTGYVRMLTPPSCSRCAILAGAWYRQAEAFDRHPGCDCRHIPAAESMAGDLTVDPRAYFDSLPESEQARIFTRAGADAIREGADVGQVVNARRGMSAAQTASGRRALSRTRQGIFATTEGNTRRGYARLSTDGRTRLMPESIAELADGDKDLYLRLLARNGYL